VITAERVRIAGAQALALATAASAPKRVAAPPSPVTLAVDAGYPPDPWQAEFLEAPDPRILLNIHRQAGKSTTAAILAMHGALYEPDTLQILLSPGLRQSGELFSKCLDVYRRIGRPVIATSETVLTLRLANGSRIVSLPGNEATVRGYSGVRRIIIDEAARVPDGLYRSVRPMLAVSGGQLIAMSTPWGKRGWWYEAFVSGGNDWRRFTVTADQCPRITAAFLAEEKRNLPALWFDQEYMGVFADMEGQVFPTDLIMAAFGDDLEPLFPDLLQHDGTGTVLTDMAPLFESTP
jgi:hypothetical protein